MGTFVVKRRYSVPIGLTSSAPGAIANLAASQVDSSTLSFTFSSAAGATSHQVRVSPRIPQSTGAVSTGRWSAPVSANSGDQITSLAPNLTYDVQVRGVNASGFGAWSNMANAATAIAASNMNTVSSVTASGDDYINGMLHGVKWAFSASPKIMTYSFPTAGSNYGAVYAAGEQNASFTAFNTAMQNATRWMFHAIFAPVIPIHFVEITETDSVHADIRLARCSIPTTAYAYYPTNIPDGSGGDVWVSISGTYSSPQIGNYAFETLLHELGHTLGLKHPHENEGGSFIIMPHSGDAGALDRDCLEFTAMSYRSFLGASVAGGLTNEAWSFCQSLMQYDIQALQYLYGANYSYATDDTTYTFDATTGRMSINGVADALPGGNRIFRTLWDGGGNDKLSLLTGGYVNGDATVDLTPGGFTITKAAQKANLGSGHSARATVFMPFRFNSDAASDIDSSEIP